VQARFGGGCLEKCQATTDCSVTRQTPTLLKKVSPEALAGSNLAEDWRMLLGSIFTNHSVHGKSQSHPQDIRQKFVELEQRQARVYPTRDLTKLTMTLADVLERVQR